MAFLVRRVRRRAVWFLAMAAGCSLVAGGCGLSLQTLPKIGGISGPTYPVNATFTDVLNLPVDAQVRVGAEVVGEVQSISAKNFDADVVLDIKRGVRLPVGTTAEVRFDNPLGDEYVLLHPPAASSGTLLQPHATLSTALTSTAPSVEDTFGALSLVLNGGGLNQLQTLIHELNNTFTGNQPQIHELLGDIDDTVTSLAGGRTAVDNALAAIRNLSTKLNAGSATIDAGLDATAPAITVLASANGDLNQLLSSLQQLGTVGAQVATQSGQDSVNDLKALTPVVQQLESVDSTLGPDLKLLSTFEAETPKIAPGDYLQVSVLAKVILPSAPSDASPGSTGSASVTEARVASTSAGSVSALLIGGLG